MDVLGPIILAALFGPIIGTFALAGLYFCIVLVKKIRGELGR